MEAAVETAVDTAVVRMQAAVDTCPERIPAAGLTVRGFFWADFFCCTRDRRNKKKQELKAAG